MLLEFKVKAEEKCFYDFEFSMNFPDDIHGDDIEELSTQRAVELLFEKAPHTIKRTSLDIVETD